MWDQKMAEVVNFIGMHKYELENHCNTFDFLKIYSDSILKHDLAMNNVLQEEENRRKSDFNNNMPRSDEEWKNTAEYANFLHEFYQTPHKFDDRP